MNRPSHLNLSIFLEFIIVYLIAICISDIISFNSDYKFKSKGSNASLSQTNINKINTKYPDLDYLFFAQKKPIPTRDLAPESKEKIKIFGLRSDGNGNGSLIIEGSNNKQVILKVGDYLKNDVQIVSINGSWIEIMNNGSIETIYFNQRKRDKPQSDNGNKKLKNSQITSQFNFLLNQLDLSEVYEKNGTVNKVVGLQVGLNSNSDINLLLGLLPFDIIKKVNSYNINSSESFVDVIDLIDTSSQINFTIERNFSNIVLPISNSLSILVNK